MMEAWSRCGRLVLDPNAGGFAVDQVSCVGKHSQDLCHLAGILQTKLVSFRNRGPQGKRHVLVIHGGILKIHLS